MPQGTLTLTISSTPDASSSSDAIAAGFSAMRHAR
jgi:hypothetical protein